MQYKIRLKNKLLKENELNELLITLLANWLLMN